MHRQRIWTLAAVVAVLIGVVVTVVVTRSGGGSAAAPRASASPPIRVIEPGRPGESARVTDSEKFQAPDGKVYNEADVAFAQMMIVHHRQAILMADLAPQRSGNAGVKAIASRMSAAQRPEIMVLQGWLKDRREPESDPSHDHGTMPGMQSAAAVAALTAARGADFDRRFVAMMTEHHQGAVQMAANLVGNGTDERLAEMADEMSSQQKSEIQRMAQLGIG